MSMTKQMDTLDMVIDCLELLLEVTKSQQETLSELLESGGGWGGYKDDDKLKRATGKMHQIIRMWHKE